MLVFDWDGTLFDSINWIVHSIQTAAKETGLQVPDEQSARSIIGLSLKQSMSVLFPGISHEETLALAENYRRHYYALDITPDGLFEGVMEMLLAFRNAGLTMAIATGKTRVGLDHALAGTGIGHFFAETRCADETASKPDPLMLNQIIQTVRQVPERTLMIGDSVHDLNMAANAGVSAVGVACGSNTGGELIRLEPLACLDNTADLRHLLGI